MNRYLKLVLVMLVLFLVVGMALAKKEEKKPYVVGAFCSVSGPNAPLGTPERDTLQMLADKINAKGGVDGHTLTLIIEDDGSDNTKAVMAAKKLIEKDNVCAIIGSSGTGPTMAVVPITEAAGIPHVSMAAGIAITNPVKKWVFRTPQTDVLAIGRILDYLTKKKKKDSITKVAMIYDSNAYGVSGKDQLRILAKDHQPKVEIVAEESFGTKDPDMTVQLTKIKGYNPDAIICWGTNPAPAQVAKNCNQLGITIPLIMSHGVANQAFLEGAGSAGNGILLPAGKLIVAEELPGTDPQKKVLTQYAKEFQEKYNKSADTFGGHAWDALSIITMALKKAGTDDRAALRDQIEQTKKFVGIGGIFNYTETNHDGLANDAFVMVKIVDGKWTLLKK